MNRDGPARRLFRPVRRALRRAVAYLGGRLLGLLATDRAVALSDIRRVLVIRIDERVGNVLLTTPLFRALAAALPGVEIDALIAASKTALVTGLVRIVPFERRDFFRRPLAFARALLALRRRRYDVAIDASHWHQFSVSSALLLAWTGAPLRIAHERGLAHLFASDLVDAPGHEPEVASKLRLLAPLGIEAHRGELETAVGLNGEARARIEGWLAERSLVGLPLVGLAPGARKLDHRAPLGLFAALAAEARALGAAAVVLWGPGEEALAAALARESDAVVAPPTDLASLAALMRLCRAVVTNDTGPMHLSVACGAPTISVFTQADHARWGHAYPPHAVISARGRALEDVIADCRRALRERLAPSREPTSGGRAGS